MISTRSVPDIKPPRQGEAILLAAVLIILPVAARSIWDRRPGIIDTRLPEPGPDSVAGLIYQALEGAVHGAPAAGRDGQEAPATGKGEARELEETPARRRCHRACGSLDLPSTKTVRHTSNSLDCYKFSRRMPGEPKDFWYLRTHKDFLNMVTT